MKKCIQIEQQNQTIIFNFIFDTNNTLFFKSHILDSIKTSYRRFLFLFEFAFSQSKI